VTAATTEATLLTVVASLRSMSGVQSARVLEYGTQPLESYLRPNDGGGFTRADWRTARSQAGGNNWALEAIDAPLAWGCETGSAAVKASVIDKGFVDIAELRPSFFGEPLPPIASGILDHGTKVSSVLGAVGNNNYGTAGMAWALSLEVRNRLSSPADYSQTYLPTIGDTIPVDDLLRENIVAAGLAGAAVINFSSNIQWRKKGILSPSPTISAHADEVRAKDDVIRNALSFLHARGAFPLIVISAGNDSVDASMAGYVGASASYPNDILVVGGIQQNRAFWPMSSRGSFVSVLAPAVAVAAVDYSGSLLLETGTSFAAPLAAGVAVLLKSFDPRLSASEIRSIMLAGAQDSVTDGVGPRRILNAYGALRVAAQRPGAPLCGNRVFIRGDSVFARRDPANNNSDELLGLFPLAWPMLAVEHGGRAISNHWYAGTGLNTLTYAPTGWTLQSRTPRFPDSGFARSGETYSHDADTSLTFSWASNSALSVALGDSLGTPLSSYLTASLGATAFGGRAGYDPSRPRAVVTLWNAALSKVFLLDWSTASVTQLTTQFANREVDFVGIAEDGSEFRALTRDFGVGLGSCHIEYVSLRPGDLGTVRRSITIPKRSNGYCMSDGAIAPRIVTAPPPIPAPPRAASPSRNRSRP
jgi:hypothetical protein